MDKMFVIKNTLINIKIFEYFFFYLLNILKFVHLIFRIYYINVNTYMIYMYTVFQHKVSPTKALFICYEDTLYLHTL